jgi:hypothetical protein
LAFWLGGVPDGTTYLPSGFAADPTNPFQTPANCASRIPAFFDFDSTRLIPVTISGSTFQAVPGAGSRVWLYWPQGADGNHTSGAITYFRAENGAYTVVDASNNPYYKSQTDLGDPNSPQGVVWPAVDMRTSSTGPIYVNPQSVQIFSSGLDVRFGAYSSTNAVTINGSTYNVLAFPTGDNYLPQTYDDITNFSGGKLESAMP